MRKGILEWDPLLAAPLVKKWEAGPGGKVALSAYQCPAGVWTIGWGHTRSVRPGNTISVMTAEEFLTEDLIAAHETLASMVRVPVTRGEFIALMDLCFNIGGSIRSYDVIKFLNNGDYQCAGKTLTRYCKSRSVRRWDETSQKWINPPIPGLLNRRKEELDYWEGKK